MPKPHVGRGERGLRKGGQLERDIQKLSDPAKRRRASEKKVADKRATIKKKSKSRPKTVAQKTADRKTIDRFSTVRTRIGRLEGMVADLRTSAKEVEASGTGNVGAAATFRKAASIRLQQIARLKKRLKGK